MLGLCLTYRQCTGISQSPKSHEKPVQRHLQDWLEESGSTEEELQLLEGAYLMMKCSAAVALVLQAPDSLRCRVKGFKFCFISKHLPKKFEP